MPGLVTEATAVARAIEGADAVISTLGPDGNTADQVVTLREGMRTVIGALHDHGMRRIVNLSGAAIDAPGDHKPRIDPLASRITRVRCGRPASLGPHPGCSPQRPIRRALRRPPERSRGQGPCRLARRSPPAPA